MSENIRKNSHQRPVDEGQPRIVAMAKEAPAAKAKPERIGDILRQARLAKDDDLYLIADYLRIKPAFLIALENSRYDEFPADAYVIGFLRTYANFLGVDGKEAVDRYRYEMAGRRKKPVLSMPTPVSEGRAPSGIIMVGATIGVLLIYTLWYGISSANRAEVHVPPPLPTAAQSAAPSMPETNAAAGLTAPVAAPTTTVVAPVVAPTPPAGSTIPPAAPGIVVTAEQSPATTAKATKDSLVPKDNPEDKKNPTIDTTTAGSRITIRAIQSSWVMVTDDSGKAVFDHVLKPGETYRVPNKPGLTLTTGNGSGIVLSLDGKEIPKIANGAPHAVHNIKLDPDHLTLDPPTDPNKE